MTFTEVMEVAVRVFESVGVAVLAAGLVLAVVVAVVALRTGPGYRPAYQLSRQVLGGSILLSLEILVAADLIRTVTIELSLESVAVLGLIVVIRTVLSFSIEIEIEGVAPWKRALLAGPVGVTAVADATRKSLGRPAEDG